jgi:hypothetical protein
LLCVVEKTSITRMSSRQMLLHLVNIVSHPFLLLPNDPMVSICTMQLKNIASNVS